MSINILLYMLMFIALVAVIIMAVIVNIRLSKIDQIGETETSEEAENVIVDEEPELEVDEEIQEESFEFEPESFEGKVTELESPPDISIPSEPESMMETEIKTEEEIDTSDIEIDSEVESELEADIQPELSETVEEEKEDTYSEFEGPGEEYNFEGEPSKEPSSPFYEGRDEDELEETVDLEMPVFIEIPDENEEKSEEIEPELVESTEPWYVPEEPVDEEKKEEDETIVTCPHCNSQVPKTIYCIYCGNSLKPNPLVEEP